MLLGQVKLNGTIEVMKEKINSKQGIEGTNGNKMKKTTDIIACVTKVLVLNTTMLSIFKIELENVTKRVPSDNASF